MKLRTVSFRGFPFLVIFTFLLGAVAANAQTQEARPAADYLRPESEIIPEHQADKNAGDFAHNQHLRWFVENTIGPESLVAGLAGAGLGTGLNNPREYGRSGQGFVRRYEMNFAETASGNAIEATLGAVWKEDPRYFRVPAESFGKRVRNVIKMTFVAYRGGSQLAPAYARYLGIAGSSFLANSWRPSSEATLHGAALRALAGFVGRMGGNAFEEFWPSVKARLFHGKR